MVTCQLVGPQQLLHGPSPSIAQHTRMSSQPACQESGRDSQAGGRSTQAPPRIWTAQQPAASGTLPAVALPAVAQLPAAHLPSAPPAAACSIHDSRPQPTCRQPQTERAALAEDGARPGCAPLAVVQPCHHECALPAQPQQRPPLAPKDEGQGLTVGRWGGTRGFG